MYGKFARYLLAGTLAATVFASAPAASAGDDDVIKRGACSGASDWKLKLSPEDGRIEVEFEVDQNVNGQVWKVAIRHNGERIFAGRRTTKAPSGSFEVRVLAPNTPGTDRFRAAATNLSSGETCVGRAGF
jgi:hypothetical protein